MSKKFYLIAHNPNSVEAAMASLHDGANALEPDVYFENGNFYVMEMTPIISKISPPKKGPLLQDYLQQLQIKLNAIGPQKLALILFDTKNLDKYDCNTLFDLIPQNFSNAFPDVAIAVTVGDRRYLNGFRNCQLRPFEGVGIDGGCEAEEANNFFNAHGLSYTFASGISVPLLSTTAPAYLNKIKNAIQIRNSSSGANPKIIYPWTVNSQTSMRTYLRLDIDGFITDNISNALKVLGEQEFVGRFEIASRGDNPF